MAHTHRGKKRDRLTDSAIRRLDRERRRPFNPRADLFKQIAAVSSAILLIVFAVLIMKGDL